MNQLTDEQKKISDWQYELISSGKIDEWNQWRIDHPEADVYLCDRNFDAMNLDGVNFATGDIFFWDENKSVKFTGKVDLSRSSFNFSRIEKAKFDSSDLSQTNFQIAKLKNVTFNKSKLINANFHSAHVEGCIFFDTNLSSTDLSAVIVDAETSFWKAKINRFGLKRRGTDLTGVALDSVRIDPPTRQLVAYNIRKKQWYKYYKKHPVFGVFFFLFWLLSDYGLSISRLILFFFLFAIIFAAIYGYDASCNEIGMIENLKVANQDGNYLVVRSLYFSIVTMTTLGFGDMYAQPSSIIGHVFLTIQVLLGYVLLGSLVSLLAVQFTASGPKGEFYRGDSKTK